MICKICNSKKLKRLFSKIGRDKNEYSILQCKTCNVIQTYPQPENTSFLYEEDYFEKRTERGYNHYISPFLKKELIRVWELNLKDLKFDKLTRKLWNFKNNLELLEIGSAAGFFLEYMKNKNWNVTGVEISYTMVEFAKKKLKLNVIHGDFLDIEFNHKYDCIVSWATIEHVKDPVYAFKKIYKILNQNGVFIFSTCRWGFFSKILKENWRFMNVPEHLFFFNEKTLDTILRDIGFRRYSMITYGSGLTKKNNMSILYRISKTVMDKLVKIVNSGDMIACLYIKN